MRHIRVLLAGASGVLDAVDPILAEAADIRIVARASEALDVLLETGMSEVDIVVAVRDDIDRVPGLVTHLLAEYPHIKVLGVTVDLTRANLYEFQLRVLPIGAITAGGLRQAIRTAMEPEMPD